MSGASANPFDDDEGHEEDVRGIKGRLVGAKAGGSGNPFDDDDEAPATAGRRSTSSSSSSSSSLSAGLKGRAGGGSLNPFDEDEDAEGDGDGTARVVNGSATRGSTTPIASSSSSSGGISTRTSPFSSSPSNPTHADARKAPSSSSSSSSPAPSMSNQPKSSAPSGKPGSGLFARLASSMSSNSSPSSPKQQTGSKAATSITTSPSTPHSAPVPIGSSSSSSSSLLMTGEQEKKRDTAGRAILTLSSASTAIISSTPPFTSSPISDMEFFSSSPLASSFSSRSTMSTDEEEREEREPPQTLDMTMINMSTEPAKEEEEAGLMPQADEFKLPPSSYVRTATSTQRLRERAEEQITAIAEYREYNLQSFRTLAEKRALLDAAAAFMDGNTLMTIILYLKDTLNSANFLSLIGTHKEAADMYLRHLRLQGRHIDRVLVYHARRDHKREGLARLALCYQVPEAEKRLAAFRDCLKFFQVLHPKLFEFESKQLMDQIKLLELQLQMERVDVARAAKGEPLFVSFPRTSTLNSGLGATLYYSLFYHSYETKGKAREIAFLPENLRKTFQINERRFYWLKLRALCCQKQWAAVKQLPSSSLFSSRPSSPIGFEPYVDMIHLFGGPAQLLREFLVLIKSPKKRYRAACRTGQYDIAIDALTVDKNEEELQWLMKDLKIRLGPVLSVEYRTKIERSLATIRAARP